MTDPHPPPDEPIDEEPISDADLASLTALLANAAVWDEPSPDLEDAVVAAVRDEADRHARADQPAEPADAGPDAIDRSARSAGSSTPAEVVPIDRARRRWLAPVLAAAATLLVVAGLGVGSRLLADDVQVDHEVALAGTELAPTASAVAEVAETPQGTRIVLDVSGLPPAPAGQYYEAWLRQSPEIGVSAGTFHLRGGDGAIELWSGVTVDTYPLITVTLQDEGGGAASSGRVVLAGRVDG